MISVIDGVNERVLRMLLLKHGKEVFSLLWINVLSFIHKILTFYRLNPMKQDIEEFHRKYALVPADKAANMLLLFVGFKSCKITVFYFDPINHI